MTRLQQEQNTSAPNGIFTEKDAHLSCDQLIHSKIISFPKIEQIHPKIYSTLSTWNADK